MTTTIDRWAILVTGDRAWDDKRAVENELSGYPTGTLIIHGNAAGADSLADMVAMQLGYMPVRVPYFGRGGRAGGPIRNQKMLDILIGLRRSGYKTRVIAFHDDLDRSKGTKDMVQRAKRKQQPVRRIKHKTPHEGAGIDR